MSGGILPKLVGRCAPDRTVETAKALRFADYVPQGNPANGKPEEPIVIGKRGKIFADGRSKQAPELVLRVGIIALGDKRGITRKAAQDQQAGIGRANRRH